MPEMMNKCIMAEEKIPSLLQDAQRVVVILEVAGAELLIKEPHLVEHFPLEEIAKSHKCRLLLPRCRIRFVVVRSKCLHFLHAPVRNLNLLIKKSRVINLINKLEFSTYGKKITVSGGYVHAEYRYLLHHAFEVYPYVESQWAGSRGMTFKVSSGLQSRYRLVHSDHCLMFAAVGLFYEFEKWEYPDPPAGIGAYAYSRSIKSHLSLSFRHSIGEHWELTTTAIHQAKPDSYLKSARLGGAIDLTYHITPKIGIQGTYRIIYDTTPIVPVRKDYNTVDEGIDISF